MTPADQIANEWIAFQRNPNCNTTPREISDRGFALDQLAMDGPHLASAAILAVVSRYADNIFVADGTEAKRVLGMSGAGPLDNLLADHGDEFIAPIEAEARRGRRLG